jgi:hypothetical protein
MTGATKSKRRTACLSRKNEPQRIHRGKRRRLGINPKEYLTDVLTRLPGMLAQDAITLTPANWLKARSGKSFRRVA